MKWKELATCVLFWTCIALFANEVTERVGAACTYEKSLSQAIAEKLWPR